MLAKAKGIALGMEVTVKKASELQICLDINKVTVDTVLTCVFAVQRRVIHLTTITLEHNYYFRTQRRRNCGKQDIR